MPRSKFQEQLATLRADVLSMGDLVRHRYRQALEAIETGDEEVARQVVEGDHAVNERYLALEGDCIDLFALQQPVAGDLRLVASSFKLLTDLERVGDLAANLAECAGHTGADRYPSVDVGEIGEFADGMLADALAAYESGDADACRAVAARDDELDARCAAAAEVVFQNLLRTGDAVDREVVVDDAISLTLVVRDLERVGDHAVNVAARTLYALEQDPELVY